MKYLAPFLLLILVSCNEQTGDEHLKSATSMYLNGQYEEALTEGKKAIQKGVSEESASLAYTIVGNIFDRLDELDSAAYYHKKSLALDSGFVDAWVNLGIVYRLKGEYDSAEYCYLTAMQLDPNDPEMLGSLGALYSFKGNPTQARFFLEKAIAIDPELANAHANLSLVLAMQGYFDEAEEELRQAVILGYKNGPIIQARIDELRKLNSN